MRDALVFVRKDVGEILHNRAMFMILVVAAFIVFMIGNSIGSNIDALTEQGVSGDELYETAQFLVGSLFLMLVFIVMLLVSLYMNAYTVLLEKTKRNLESVLCTPVRLSSLWMGKTLATFIPALLLGLVLAFAVLVIMNMTVLEPAVGRLVFPGAAILVASLLAVPVIVFLLSSLIILLQMMLQNVRLIQTLFTALIFGSSFGLSYAFRFSDTGWMVVYIAFGVVAVVSLAVWLLSRRLTKERIVLTSKG